MFFELETEYWETLPDNYDGAAEMTKRGRIEVLELMFRLESYGELSEKEKGDSL